MDLLNKEMFPEFYPAHCFWKIFSQPLNGLFNILLLKSLASLGTSLVALLMSLLNLKQQ